MNSLDRGHRRFIIVQLDEETGPESEAAAAGFPTVAAIARTRIQRAGKQVLDEAGFLVDGLDCGFRYLRVDTTNMADTLASVNDVSQIALTEAINRVKPGRSHEDLLFQVLLDWGLDLGESVTAGNVDGREVLSFGDDVVVACFADDISAVVVSEIAQRHPLRAVFLDAGFASDAARINAEQIFREVSPETEVRTI